MGNPGVLPPDLSGLPPAYLVTRGFDPLRDEGELFARRLAQAGVGVTPRREPDLIHGFADMLGISVRCREAVGKRPAHAGRPRNHHWLALSRQRPVSAMLDLVVLAALGPSSASRSVSSSTPCCAQCSIPCCAQSWASLAAVI